MSATRRRSWQARASATRSFTATFVVDQDSSARLNDSRTAVGGCWVLCGLIGRVEDAMRFSARTVTWRNSADLWLAPYHDHMDHAQLVDNLEEKMGAVATKLAGGLVFLADCDHRFSIAVQNLGPIAQATDALASLDSPILLSPSSEIHSPMSDSLPLEADQSLCSSGGLSVGSSYRPSWHDEVAALSLVRHAL